MPPLPFVSNALKCQMQYAIGNDFDVLNTLHFSYTGGIPSGTDCATLAADVTTAWTSHLRAFLDNADVFTGATITDLSSATGAVGVSTINQTGTRTGGPTPAGCAALINFSIARHYRGGKPRLYTPFFTATDLVSRATWNTTSAANLEAAWAAFIGALVGATAGSTVIADQINVSYYHGFTVVTNPVTGRARNKPTVRSTPLVDVVTASGVNLKPGSQRRRNRP